MKRFLFSVITVALVSLTFTSCFKKAYDSPPNLTGNTTVVPTNMTIGQLRDMALSNAGVITNDSTIGGVVVADDRTGNLYKEIVIQDSTGGITLLLDQNSIYTTYPVGMKIYIKLKGLYVGLYSGLPELGYSINATGISKIPSSLAGNFITQGSFPNTITPPHFTVAQLTGKNNNLLNTLITIDSVEFAAGSYDSFYAIPYGNGAPASTTLYIENCAGQTLQLYNSSYAAFATARVPGGKGSITCIYSIYGTTPQLLINDTTGVNMKGTRCNGTSGSQPATIITIDSLKKLYYAAEPDHSTAYALPVSYQLACVVTQDATTGNLTAGNIVVQDGSFKGIDLYFGSSASPVIGDSILVDITGGTVSRYKPGTGSLEIALKSTNKIVTIAKAVSVTPLVMNVADIDSKYVSSDLEYVIVKILGATISGNGPTYGDKLTIADGSGGTGISFFNQYATFSTQTYPTGTLTSVTGLLVSYNSLPEMQLRTTADVVQ